MKQCIFILSFAFTAIHAASTAGIVDTVINPPLPSIVINNMVKHSLIEISQRRPEVLSSSIGSAFVTLQTIGGIDTLCYVSPILNQTQRYISAITSDAYLAGLGNTAKRLKEENKPEFERAVAWAKFDSAYRILQKKLVEADVPGFTLLATPRETIEYNKEIVLDDSGLVYFSAAQLSMGLAMQEQFNIDPITFYLMYKAWIPSELKAQSGSFLWSWLWPGRGKG